MVNDSRTPEHGYTISSYCEPNSSGELDVLDLTSSPNPGYGPKESED